MKPAAFHYHAARSVDEAVALLAELGEDARIIAGGQSLGPMLNLRVARPSDVIDISKVGSLREIRASGNGLWIGAAVTHARLEDEPLPGVLGALLRNVASGIAYRAIRNRGTIGGSLAHADPAADWPVVLSALGARVHLASREGRRVLLMDRFALGVFETALAPSEMIEGIEIPALPEGARWGFSKQVQSHGSFASALSICLAFEPGRHALWLGACGGQPINATEALAGIDHDNPAADVTAATRESVTALLDDGDVSPMGRYRRHLHSTNAAFAVEQAIAA